MKIYLDLLEGNRKSLQGILGEHFGHSTLNRKNQPYNRIPLKPITPTQTVPTTTQTNNLPTPPPQLASTTNVLQQFLSQQQPQQPPQLPPQLFQSQSSNSLLQKHSQLLQLAQQQQYINQFNAALNNPNAPFNLQALHLGSQLTPPPGSHLNLPQQAGFQNTLGNFNFNSNAAVNQLLQQQQQQQQQQQAAAAAAQLNVLQSKIS